MTKFTQQLCHFSIKKYYFPFISLCPILTQQIQLSSSTPGSEWRGSSFDHTRNGTYLLLLSL